jgi:hypothetical protein
MEAHATASLIDFASLGWARGRPNGPPRPIAPRAARRAAAPFTPGTSARESIDDLVLLLSRPSMFDGDGQPLTPRERLFL